MRAQMRHAFAMPEPLELTEDDRALLRRLAELVVRRRLSSPALMLLEIGRPVNYVASQFLQFLNPFATMVLKGKDYERFVHILEHRQGIQAMVDMIDEVESERTGSGVRGPRTSA